MNEQVKIQAGVIHRIIKPQFATREETGIKLQPKLHEPNKHLLGFIAYAEQILSKRGSNRSISGGFGIESTLSRILSDHLKSEMKDNDYLIITQMIVSGLFEFVVKKSATSGEYIPVIFYKKDEKHYLLISLISLSEYINIDEHGEFRDTSAIDSEALKVGVLIDLDEMEKHHLSKTNDFEPNYIRWIQRRSGKLPDYIQEFIPVGKKIDDRKSTKDFFSALNDFLTSTFEKEDARAEVQSEVVAIMRTRFDNGETIHIEEDIDPIVTSAMKRFGVEKLPDFGDFRSKKKLQLNSSFIPEKSTLESFERFKIELSDGDISIRGKTKDLGRKVQIFTDGGEKYLKIRLHESEYNQLRERHSQLEEQ